MVAPIASNAWFLDDAALSDVRAAIQAAWLANSDATAIEIAKRYDLYGKLCLRCAAWETRWTLCVPCARHEIQMLSEQGMRFPRERVRAFQEQWSAENPDDSLLSDGIVGIATMVRGWRPYHTYGIASGNA